MDVSEAIETRIEVREYADESIDDETRRAILEAARLAPTGHNSQHWRFVLVDGGGDGDGDGNGDGDGDDLDRLAAISTTGDWVADADFAVVVLTDPSYPYHLLDAGRAITHMQFVAWERGVGSCIYTGYDDAEMREFLDAPAEYDVAAVVAFGYPPFEVEGRKNRKPLEEIAFEGRFGDPVPFEEPSER